MHVFRLSSKLVVKKEWLNLNSFLRLLLHTALRKKKVLLAFLKTTYQHWHLVFSKCPWLLEKKSGRRREGDSLHALVPSVYFLASFLSWLFIKIYLTPCMVSAVHTSNQCGSRVYTRVLRSTMAKRVVNKVPITVLYDVSNAPPFDLCNLLYETSFWVQNHCFMLANFLNFLYNFT